VLEKKKPQNGGQIVKVNYASPILKPTEMVPLRCATAHRIKSLLVIIQSERVCDHARDIDLAAIEKLDGAREAVHMREGSVNLSTLNGFTLMVSLSG